MPVPCAICCGDIRRAVFDGDGVGINRSRDSMRCARIRNFIIISMMMMKKNNTNYHKNFICIIKYDSDDILLLDNIGVRV